MTTLNLQLSNILAELNTRAYRHKLLSTNIANADTPGYYAKDLDFKEALRAASSTRNMQYEKYEKYRVSTMQSLDANTVELDTERTQLAENAVMYELSLMRASHFFKTLETAIKG